MGLILRINIKIPSFKHLEFILIRFANSIGTYSIKLLLRFRLHKLANYFISRGITVILFKLRFKLVKFYFLIIKDKGIYTKWFDVKVISVSDSLNKSDGNSEI